MWFTGGRKGQNRVMVRDVTLLHSYKFWSFRTCSHDKLYYFLPQPYDLLSCVKKNALSSDVFFSTKWIRTKKHLNAMRSSLHNDQGWQRIYLYMTSLKKRKYIKHAYICSTAFRNSRAHPHQSPEPTISVAKHTKKLSPPPKKHFHSRRCVGERSAPSGGTYCSHTCWTSVKLSEPD